MRKRNGQEKLRLMMENKIAAMISEETWRLQAPETGGRIQEEVKSPERPIEVKLEESKEEDELSQKVFRILPKDVPPESEAFEKVKVAIDTAGNLRAEFKFPAGTEKVNFQITERAAANDISIALRIARICYQRFLEGQRKEEVTKFKKECLIDLRNTLGNQPLEKVKAEDEHEEQCKDQGQQVKEERSEVEQKELFGVRDQQEKQKDLKNEQRESRGSQASRTTIPTLRATNLKIRTELGINKVEWTALVRSERKKGIPLPCMACSVESSEDAKHDRACLDFQVVLAERIQDDPILMEPLLAERQKVEKKREECLANKAARQEEKKAELTEKRQDLIHKRTEEETARKNKRKTQKGQEEREDQDEQDKKRKGQKRGPRRVKDDEEDKNQRTIESLLTAAGMQGLVAAVGVQGLDMQAMMTLMQPGSSSSSTGRGN